MSGWSELSLEEVFLERGSIDVEFEDAEHELSYLRVRVREMAENSKAARLLLARMVDRFQGVTKAEFDACIRELERDLWIADSLARDREAMPEPVAPKFKRRAGGKDNSHGQKKIARWLSTNPPSDKDTWWKDWMGRAWISEDYHLFVSSKFLGEDADTSKLREGIEVVKVGKDLLVSLDWLINEADEKALRMNLIAVNDRFVSDFNRRKIDDLRRVESPPKVDFWRLPSPDGLKIPRK